MVGFHFVLSKNEFASAVEMVVISSFVTGACCGPSVSMKFVPSSITSYPDAPAAGKTASEAISKTEVFRKDAIVISSIDGFDKAIGGLSRSAATPIHGVCKQRVFAARKIDYEALRRVWRRPTQSADPHNH